MKVPSLLSSLIPWHRNERRLERAFRFALFRKWDNLHVSCVCRRLSTFVLILSNNLSLTTHLFMEYAYQSFGKSVEYTWCLYLELYNWKTEPASTFIHAPPKHMMPLQNKMIHESHQSTRADCWHCSQHIIPCKVFAKHNLERGPLLCPKCYLLTTPASPAPYHLTQDCPLTSTQNPQTWVLVCCQPSH